MLKKMKDNLENPLVSICLITYNHEKYIKQAVDSILKQHLNFTYEVIIADDASVDQTQEILRKNYENVPNVKLILREKNANGKNTYLTLQEAKGKYICFCEGDDYWIGADGIQILVDWLENNEGYVGVCGRRLTLSERTGVMFVSYDKKTDNKEIELNDCLNNKTFFDMTAILYRNFYHDKQYDYRAYLASHKVGDLAMMLYILLHGKVFQLDNIVGIYRADRIHGTSAYNANNTPKKIFEDHIELISNLPKLIHTRLNYTELKKLYTMNYLSTFVSTYEVIKQTSYILNKVGVKMTLKCLKERIKYIRE